MDMNISFFQFQPTHSDAWFEVAQWSVQLLKVWLRIRLLLLAWHQWATDFSKGNVALKAHLDGLCKIHMKVAYSFACVQCSELETILSTSFYAGLNQA